MFLSKSTHSDEFSGNVLALVDSSHYYLLTHSFFKPSSALMAVAEELSESDANWLVSGLSCEYDIRDVVLFCDSELRYSHHSPLR